MTVRLNVEAGKRADKDFFDVVDIAANVASLRFQRQYGVANQLPWAVVCDVAPAVAGLLLDPVEDEAALARLRADATGKSAIR